MPSTSPTSTQQLGEQRSQTGAGVAALTRGQLQVAAVRVDVLAEQRDLGDTVLGELAHLVEHVVVRPADLGAAHGGHDAERAVVVAPDLDRDPGVVARLAPGGQRRREHGVVVDHRLFEDLDQRTIAAMRPRAGARRRGGRCGCPSRRRRTWPWRRRSRGPSGPGSPTRRSGDPRWASFHGRRWPRLPYSLLSAFSRMQHVLSTTTSASSSDSARTIPSASSRPGDALGVVLVHLAPVGAHDVAAGHVGKAIAVAGAESWIAACARTSRCGSLVA